MMASTNRQEEIRDIHKRYRWFYELLAGVAILIISILIGAAWSGDENHSYQMNLVTEVIGIGATVFIINRLYEYRDRENLKRRLVREAGSRANAIAIAAVEQLREEGWLTGDSGLLKGLDLSGANLKNADLSEANLRWTNLKDADLRSAKLIGTDLRDTDLRFARLKSADLSQAKLNSAKLFGAKLQKTKLYGADFMLADLRNADLCKAEVWATNYGEKQQRGVVVCEKNIPPPAKLRYAKLQGAYLEGAILHGQWYQGAIPPHESYLYCAVLPDEEKYTPITDMKKYTDPQHPEFQETLDKIKNIRQGNKIIPTPKVYVIRDENE